MLIVVVIARETIVAKVDHLVLVVADFLLRLVRKKEQAFLMVWIGHCKGERVAAMKCACLADDHF